jgi:hypothetical protein
VVILICTRYTHILVDSPNTKKIKVDPADRAEHTANKKQHPSSTEKKEDFNVQKEDYERDHSKKKRAEKFNDLLANLDDEITSSPTVVQRIPSEENFKVCEEAPIEDVDLQPTIPEDEYVPEVCTRLPLSMNEQEIVFRKQRIPSPLMERELEDLIQSQIQEHKWTAPEK